MSFQYVPVSSVQSGGFLDGLITTAAEKAKMEDLRTANEMNFNAWQADLTRQANSAQAALDRNFQASQAAINRNFNSSEAQKAYDRSVDYSRQVSELKRAGLNPAMIYGSGTTEVGSSTAATAGALAAGSRASSGAASVSTGGPGNESDIFSLLVNSAVKFASAYMSRGASSLRK